jgi:hypothetical protein
MTRAARTYRVIFWEEPMIEEGIEPHLARFPQNERLEVVTPKLPAGMSEQDAESVLKWLLDGLLEEKGQPAVLWYITPAMLSFSKHLKPEAIVYDNMDELSAFQGAPKALLKQEEELLRRTSVVFTGGMSIFEAKKHRHNNIHPFPSSIDKAHFAAARARDVEDPRDQAEIPRPRIGWFGVIDERFDGELLRELAELRPDWQFVMIGPVVKIDEKSLPRSGNIHWLGGKSYDQLPDYLRGWDAGLIPFAINDATRFISPTKTPEFLAAGIPLVSTPIQDIVRPYRELDLVEIAEDAHGFADAIDRLLVMPKTPWLERVDAFLADKSWDHTWRDMNALLSQARQHRPSSQGDSL